MESETPRFESWLYHSLGWCLGLHVCLPSSVDENFVIKIKGENICKEPSGWHIASTQYIIALKIIIPFQLKFYLYIGLFIHLFNELNKCNTK